MSIEDNPIYQDVQKLRKLLDQWAEGQGIIVVGQRREFATNAVEDYLEHLPHTVLSGRINPRSLLTALQDTSNNNLAIIADDVTDLTRPPNCDMLLMALDGHVTHLTGPEDIPFEYTGRIIILLTDDALRHMERSQRALLDRCSILRFTTSTQKQLREYLGWKVEAHPEENTITIASPHTAATPELAVTMAAVVDAMITTGVRVAVQRKYTGRIVLLGQTVPHHTVYDGRSKEEQEKTKPMTDEPKED